MIRSKPKKAVPALAYIVFTFIFLAGACKSPTDPDLKGGILVTFDVSGERYSIFITNTETIEKVYALQSGTSRATIPSGRVIKGQVPYNKPWSWHIDSQDIHMAEVTMEVCDGRPSFVEANIDGY